MNNFVFQNHTRIYFGKGVVGQYLAKLLAPQGDDKALAAAGVEALAGFIRSVGLPTSLQQLA